jgi:hypothetical protein
MIYKFRLLGGGDRPFYRDFQLNDNHTFLDFHKAIQEELGYDKNQMASFFLANSKWERGLEINLFDMTEDSFTPVIIMEQTELNELINEEKQRLLYLFDFFSDRAFYIELNSIIPEDKNKTGPICTGGKGNPPDQIIIGDTNLPDL